MRSWPRRCVTIAAQLMMIITTVMIMSCAALMLLLLLLLLDGTWPKSELTMARKGETLPIEKEDSALM